MKLQRIRYFVTLAQTLSFSRTAEIHYVSQTTISLQIRELEDELGVKLFNRTKRKVELTPAGHVFLEDALKIVDLVDRADEKMLLFRDAPVEPLSLRVLVANSLKPGCIVPALNGFKSANPDVFLSCVYRPMKEIHSALVLGEADVGLMFDLGEHVHDDVEAVTIGRIAQCVVVNKNSYLAQCEKLTRSQLVGERFVNTPESHDLSLSEAEKSGFSNELAAPAERESACEKEDARLGGEAREGEGSAGTPDAAESADGCDKGSVAGDIMVKNLDELFLAVALGEGYTLLSEPLAKAISPGLDLAVIPLDEEKTPVIAIRLQDAKNPASDRFFDHVRAQQDA